jgi:hypothetical protein
LQSYFEDISAKRKSEVWNIYLFSFASQKEHCNVSFAANRQKMLALKITKGKV